jgi:SpoVK/Ycf46/Vps4 family AAA+-type ATPase
MDLFNYNHNTENKNSEMYIVSQHKPFLYDEKHEIYAMANFISEESSDDKNKQNVKIDKITLVLFSYRTNTHTIKNMVKKLKENYIHALEKERSNKKFIYTLTKTSYENFKYECWNEYPFESTRKFENIFFERKCEVLEKIKFFIENKKWYYEMGIPYSLGIGLYGPPGTGKTSFFKCLANMTGRHLIILSLKIIKTRRQLEDFFFEDRYNSNNKRHDISFDKKIIIIEDIDCLGDIVWKRNPLSIDKKSKENSLSNKKVTVSDIVQSLVENSNDQNKILLPKTEEDLITLDDILNLWDGLKETPGRILGISSNHYDMLDPALVRPGRIDITLNLDNVSHEIIQEMFKKYYNKVIDDKKLKKIKNKFYSPAEIINFYIMYKNEPDKFVQRLMMNEKI